MAKDSKEVYRFLESKEFEQLATPEKIAYLTRLINLLKASENHHASEQGNGEKFSLTCNHERPALSEDS